MNNLTSAFEGVMFTNKDQVIERLQEEGVSLSSAGLSDQMYQFVHVHSLITHKIFLILCRGLFIK